MQERQEKMSQNDIIKLIQELKPSTISKREKKLADEYNRDIAKTVTYIAKQITQIWKIIVIVNTCAIIIITLLQGFEWSSFHLDLESFVITISSLTISSFLLGTVSKLLKLKQ